MTGCSFLAIRRYTVDVDLAFSAQVGESWGTMRIEQRRVTDNRLMDQLQSLDFGINDAISGHYSSTTHALCDCTNVGMWGSRHFIFDK